MKCRYEAEFFDQAFQAEARLLAQPEALAAQPDVEVRDMTISTPLGVVVCPGGDVIALEMPSDRSDASYSKTLMKSIEI